MTKTPAILILGDGRIAKAVSYYLKHLTPSARIASFAPAALKGKPKGFSLIISCLPSKEAALGLELALRHKVDILDISDLDPPYYLKKKKDIEGADILVVPGCGFCPGLVNFILSREIAANPKINRVIIKAGSFSRRKHYFPFLWCFDDLIQEHRLSSQQIISGTKVRLHPFSGLEKEKILSVPLESYFSVSGFENILNKRKFQDFHFRVIRPEGFMAFFKFLENYGLFAKRNINKVRPLLESIRLDNYTIATIELFKNNQPLVYWQVRAFSKKNEQLNSMQKITALVSASLTKLLYFNPSSAKPKGLIFMEGLAENGGIFRSLLSSLRKNGILIYRRPSVHA